VPDKKAIVLKVHHTKASGEKQIGTPLQGLLSKIFVAPGQTVKKNAPLFTIEAMKMETTITATRDLKIRHISLKEGTLVESEDLVVEVE
jgi:pyruvate carboxylase